MKRNSINTEKTKALISLLDDPDGLVYDSVRTELLNADFEIIPELQRALHATEDELQSGRLAEIFDQIKLEKLTLDMENWRENDEPDLVEGMLHIARYGHPDLDTHPITNKIAEMVESVKSEIQGKTPSETIEVLNRVILHDFGFGGSLMQYSALNNSFINKVFETRQSNPIGLSVLYLLVAKATGIPLVGINSPGHFILGYKAEDDGNNDIIDKIAFFIDPFSNGKIVKNKHFKTWLKEQAVPKEALDSLIATEKAIIKRVFNNLIYALCSKGENDTAEKLLVVAESI